MKSTRRKISGFTLMELLIVMVILSILTAIVIGTYAVSMKRGRDNRRKSDLKNIATALEYYYNDQGRYPAASSGKIKGCGALGAEVECNWGGEFKQTGTNTLYMVMLPADPKSGQMYYYATIGAGTGYKLYAKLENTQDEGVGVSQNPGYSGTVCGSGVTCTYGIASPNTSP